MRNTFAASVMRWIVTLCLVGGVAGMHAGTPTIEGRIVGVSDGDTVTLLDADRRQHKIRLDGIDAPEGGQPFGGTSKRRLSDLVFDREAVAECAKKDRYGRPVCKLLIGGADAGLVQVRSGMTWYFRRYANELDPERRKHYDDAESVAKAERRGLWADAGPVPPWEWRQRKSTLREK